jgi:hypothetical protein
VRTPVGRLSLPQSLLLSAKHLFWAAKIRSRLMRASGGCGRLRQRLRLARSGQARRSRSLCRELRGISQSINRLLTIQCCNGSTGNRATADDLDL